VKNQSKRFSYVLCDVWRRNGVVDHFSDGLRQSEEDDMKHRLHCLLLKPAEDDEQSPRTVRRHRRQRSSSFDAWVL